MASPGRAIWFWATAGVLFLFITASAAPAPLYRVYQEEWGFTATTLTGVFAVYVLALLVTLLVAGSLSDHVGRRVVIGAGLVLEIVACLAFLAAGDLDTLFVARASQGVAVG